MAKHIVTGEQDSMGEKAEGHNIYQGRTLHAGGAYPMPGGHTQCRGGTPNAGGAGAGCEAAARPKMAAGNQPEKRRLPYFGKSPSSVPDVSPSQGQRLTENLASDTGQSGHGFRGKLVAVKSRLVSFHRGQSSMATGSDPKDPEPPEAAQNDGDQSVKQSPLLSKIWQVAT
ncbi:hypothetical protein EDD15DRAFT_2195837 [Pisolithus albus]|nr:hypothetical protein EDD15DRAFT_2195837 [Pisolithus albus]